MTVLEALYEWFRIPTNMLLLQLEAAIQMPMKYSEPSLLLPILHFVLLRNNYA